MQARVSTFSVFIDLGIYAISYSCGRDFYCHFFQKVVTVCPLKLPSSLVSPLVSIVVSDSEPVDTMTWSSLATLAEICMSLTKFYWC